MVKDSTIALLALGGGALFLLRRGIGEVGEGIAGGLTEGVGGVGEGLGQIGRETGELGANISGFFDPLGALGEASALEFDLTSQLRREAQRREGDLQGDIFEVAQPRLIEEGAEKDIFRAEQQTERSRLRQSALTSATRFIASGGTAGFVIREGRRIALRTLPLLGNVSAEFSRALRKDAPVSLQSEPAVAGSLDLPSGDRQVRRGSGGGGGSGLRPTGIVRGGVDVRSILSRASQAVRVRQAARRKTLRSRAKSLLRRFTSRFRR